MTPCLSSLETKKKKTNNNKKIYLLICVWIKFFNESKQVTKLEKFFLEKQGKKLKIFIFNLVHKEKTVFIITNKIACATKGALTTNGWATLSAHMVFSS